MTREQLAESAEWQAFLTAIRKEPNNDLPRLVAADFLEENGFVERAAFIRDQIDGTTRRNNNWTAARADVTTWTSSTYTKSRKQRSCRLRQRYGGTGTPQDAPLVKFERGFVQELTLRPDVAQLLLPQLLRLEPLSLTRTDWLYCVMAPRNYTIITHSPVMPPDVLRFRVPRLTGKPLYRIPTDEEAEGYRHTALALCDAVYNRIPHIDVTAGIQHLSREQDDGYGRLYMTYRAVNSGLGELAKYITQWACENYQNANSANGW